MKEITLSNIKKLKESGNYKLFCQAFRSVIKLNKHNPEYQYFDFNTKTRSWSVSKELFPKEYAVNIKELTGLKNYKDERFLTILQ